MKNLYLNRYVFFVGIIFLLQLLIAQSEQELLSLAKQKYKEALKSNESLRDDTSDNQRHQTLKIIKEAQDTYSKLLEQFPEIEDKVEEEIATLNSCRFWILKFTPITFEEDEETSIQKNDFIPKNKKNLKIEPEKLPEAKKLEEKKKESPFPVESAYYFRLRVAKLLQIRRFFEARTETQKAKKITTHPEYKKELQELVEDIDHALDFYKGIIELTPQIIEEKFKFKLITPLDFEGTVKGQEKRCILLDSPQIKKIDFFMLSCQTLMEFAQRKNAINIEYQGAIFYFLLGEYSLALKWFESHLQIQDSQRYAKLIKQISQREKNFENLQKERKQVFIQEAKVYQLFSEMLLFLQINNFNSALNKISKFYKLVNLDLAEELQIHLQEKKITNWVTLIQELRYNCSLCLQERFLVCRTCMGNGSLSRKEKDKYIFYDCYNCRKGRIICRYCHWRFYSKDAVAVESFFPYPNNQIIYNNIFFLTPVKKEESLTRPIFIRYEKNYEEYFIIKILELTYKKGVQQYKLIRRDFRLENNLLLEKKETSSNKEYMVIVNGYADNVLISQGRTIFRVNKTQLPLEKNIPVEKEAEEFITTGDIKYKNRDYKGAIEEYTKAISINPKDEELWINRGNCYIKLEQYTEVIRDFSEVLFLNPDLYYAYACRGWAKQKMESYNEAIQDYDRGLEINPNSDYLYCNRGIAKAKIGDIEGALQDYDEAITLKKALLLMEHKDSGGKIIDNDEAIPLNNENFDPYLRRGLAQKEVLSARVMMSN
jgi:tetratricopeptide (TPR) repeat protein